MIQIYFLNRIISICFVIIQSGGNMTKGILAPTFLCVGILNESVFIHYKLTQVIILLKCLDLLIKNVILKFKIFEQIFSVRLLLYMYDVNLMMFA